MPEIRLRHCAASVALACLAAQPAQADHNYFVIHGPPPMHWTGFYWGGHVGLQWSEVAGDSLVDPGASASFEEQSWSAGLGFGYDREISRVVFGWTVDVDLTLPEIDGRVTEAVFPSDDVMAEHIIFATELKWLTTVRGRIGYRMERFLPFATAGVAVANATSSLTAELTNLSDPTMASTVRSEGSEWVAGWAAGAGL